MPHVGPSAAAVFSGPPSCRSWKLSGFHFRGCAAAAVVPREGGSHAAPSWGPTAELAAGPKSSSFQRAGSHHALWMGMRSFSRAQGGPSLPAAGFWPVGSRQLAGIEFRGWQRRGKGSRRAFIFILGILGWRRSRQWGGGFRQLLLAGGMGVIRRSVCVPFPIFTALVKTFLVVTCGKGQPPPCPQRAATALTLLLPAGRAGGAEDAGRLAQVTSPASGRDICVPPPWRSDALCPRISGSCCTA